MGEILANMTQVSDVAPGPLVSHIHLIFGTLLAIPRYRSSLCLVLIHWFFKKLWPFKDLEKNHELSVFHTFFSLCLQIFLWYLVHWLCNNKIQIKFEFGFDPLIFHEVMALGLKKKITNCYFSGLFFSLLTDIHLIFGTLLCHTLRYRLSLSLVLIHWFFMALGLRKKSWIISFPDFFSLCLKIFI
jgi:hypothetical protein